jgi:hypothetical protein
LFIVLLSFALDHPLQFNLSCRLERRSFTANQVQLTSIRNEWSRMEASDAPTDNFAEFLIVSCPRFFDSTKSLTRIGLNTELKLA